jgi:hypothetical protein
MNWGYIFENYIIACYEFYKWTKGEEECLPFEKFNERLFYDALINSGFIENHENILIFFDELFIWCYVAPLGIKSFRSCAESELRKIICHDHPTRKEALIQTIENAFFLLNERELEKKKINYDNI